MYKPQQSPFGKTCISASAGIFGLAGHPGYAPRVPSLLTVSHSEHMQNPALTPTAWTVSDGVWSDSDVWVNGVIPTDSDRVVIAHSITVDDTSATADGVYIWQDGLLAFDHTVDTRLTVTTIVVDYTGTLQIGTEADPINAAVVAEVLFRDVALPSEDDDPSQFFNGLLCFGDAVVRMYGATKTTDASSLRLSVEPLSGATTLTMENVPSGWLTGDKIVLPASDPQWWISQDGLTTGLPYPYLGETFTIDSITLNVITLDHALINDHPGARDRNGDITFLPHLVNLTRNVRIRSENPDGVRGHCLFGHMADVKINYASAVELGRTTARMQPGNTTDTFDNATFSGPTLTHYGLNQAGRYPWHFHHIYGPENLSNTGYQFELIGCSVDGGKKWGVTIHGASYGHVEANNIWNCQAAGIGLEGGNEAYCLFHENTSMELVGIPGNTEGPDGIVPSDGSATTVNNGYWMLEAGGNTWTNNVAAGMNGNSVYLGHGFHLDGLRRGGSVTGGGNTPERYPLFRGADVDSGTEGVDYELKDVNTTEYADFSGNEAYGALKAFSMDHYGVYPGTITYTDCSSWATAFESWFIYGADGSASVINPVVRRSVFTAFGPNSMGKTVLRLSGGDIQTITGVGLEWIGGNSALDGFPANHLIVEDTLIAAPQPVVVNLSDPATHGPPDRVLPAKIWTLTNCLLINTDAGANLITMVPKQPGTTHSDNPMTFEQVFLEDFQQSSGDNFQLFWNEQAASASAPGPSAASGYACPVDGLTNQQCFDTYGRAFGGELMDAGAVTETWLAGGKALAAVPSNTLKTNLAAYYKHDEASGNLLDSHSTHDGIAPGSEPTSTTGKILGGRQYTAASSQNFVVDGSGGEFVTSISGNPFGMCCWLYFDSFPAFAQVISRTSGNGYELRLNAAGALQFLAAFPLDGSANVISTVSLSTGTWYFVVAWYDNILNKMRISVNNAASDDVTPSVAPIINGTFDLAVGARTNNSLYFNGRMDEMAIWMDRFPTASEQTLIYGGGSGFAFSNWH